MTALVQVPSVLDRAVNISFHAALVLMAAGILCAGFRLLRGPTLPDRVAGIDSVALLGVGAITIYAMWVGQSIYLYVSVAMALLIFLGTVGFAYYLEVSKRP